MKRTLKKTVTYGFAIMLLACVALLFICNLLVVNNARGKTFSEIDSIKYNKVGLLLGTTPQARLRLQITSLSIASMQRSSCIRPEK